jgi:GNAT superfamily N-acetyltransferase
MQKMTRDSYGGRMRERIVSGYIPGAIGRVTELHGTYYATHWDLGLFFEAKAATELAAFLSRFEATRDGFWVALVDDRLVGSITIDGIEATTRGARLRWFIITLEYQGRGLGKQLMRTAIDFCKQARYTRVYLTTFAGLDAARHLYEQWGFRLTQETQDSHWGKTLTEQVFELTL